MGTERVRDQAIACRSALYAAVLMLVVVGGCASQQTPAPTCATPAAMRATAAAAPVVGDQPHERGLCHDPQGRPANLPPRLCGMLPPPSVYQHPHGEEGFVDCSASGRACVREVDPGPYQIWEDWGQGWYLVGVLNVSKPDPHTRIERWAFTRYNATTNPLGYHHPSQGNTQIYLWFGRLDASANGEFYARYPGVNAGTSDQDNTDFNNWVNGVGGATGALAKLQGWYSNYVGNIASPEVFISSVTCMNGQDTCDLGTAGDQSANTPPAPQPTQRPSAPRPH